MTSARTISAPVSVQGLKVLSTGNLKTPKIRGTDMRILSTGSKFSDKVETLRKDFCMYQKFFHNISTYEELIRKGETAGTIRAKVNRNELLRVIRGIYTSAEFARELNEFEKPLARIVATAKSCQNPVFSHISAAYWLGVPAINIPQTVHLVTVNDLSHRRSGVTVHRNNPQAVETAVLHNGLYVTNPRQTLTDCLDKLPFIEALNITNYFLSQQLVTFDIVHEILSSARAKDRVKAKTISERLNIQCESPLETLIFNLMCEWGIRRPAQQIWIRCGNGERYRADFAWEDVKVILEADGLIKYSGKFGDPVDVIRSERSRQRSLERLGWKVIRVEWDEVMNSPNSIRQRLFDAGVR